MLSQLEGNQNLEQGPWLIIDWLVLTEQSQLVTGEDLSLNPH